MMIRERIRWIGSIVTILLLYFIFLNFVLIPNAIADTGNGTGTITSPNNNDVLSDLNTITGTATDSDGDLGITGGGVAIRNNDLGKWWDPTQSDFVGADPFQESYIIGPFTDTSGDGSYATWSLDVSSVTWLPGSYTAVLLVGDGAPNPNVDQINFSISPLANASVSITDADTDKVYFDSNLISFDVTGLNFSDGTTIRVAFGVFNSETGFTNGEVVTGLTSDPAGYWYKDAVVNGGKISFSDLPINNPSNDTTYQGVIGIQIYTDSGGGNWIPTDDLPLLVANPDRNAIIGVYIPPSANPAEDVTATPLLSEIANLYNTEQAITFTKAGHGSITFPPGLNIIGNQAELAALQNNIGIVSGTDGNYYVEVNTDSLTFLQDKSAQISMLNIPFSIVNITSDSPEGVVSNINLDTVTDTLTFDVNHFSRYTITDGTLGNATGTFTSPTEGQTITDLDQFTGTANDADGTVVGGGVFIKNNTLNKWWNQNTGTYVDTRSEECIIGPFINTGTNYSTWSLDVSSRTWENGSYTAYLRVGDGEPNDDVATVNFTIQTDEAAVAAAKAELTFDVIKNTNTAVDNITDDLNLVGDDSSFTNLGVNISWVTTNNAINSTTGVVTRPDWDTADSSGTLTATLTKGAASDTVVFNTIVKKLEPTDEQAVAAAKTDLDADTIKGTNTDLNNVTSNLNLVTSGSYETTIVWSSNNTNVIANDGTVYRQDSNTTVTLTATISKNAVNDTKQFDVTVLANTEGNATGTFTSPTEGQIITDLNQFTGTASDADGTVVGGGVFIKNNTLNKWWNQNTGTYVDTRSEECIIGPFINTGTNYSTWSLDVSSRTWENGSYTAYLRVGDGEPNDDVATVNFTVSYSSSGGDSGESNTPPTQETSPIFEEVVTNDDQILVNSLKENMQAKITLNNKPEPKVEFSPKIVNSLVQENKPLVIENKSVTLNFTAQSLVTDELSAALKDDNAVVELGAKEVTIEEKQQILAQAGLGQSTGLFEIGGKVVDLTAQITRTNTNGTTSSEKIDNFNEPVAVTIDLSDLHLSQEDIDNLTGIRYEKYQKGNIVPVKLGGTYDPVTKTFTFYTDKFSLYSVVKASKLTKINLAINKLIQNINGQQVEIDIPPTILNNRTMVPLRFVGESMGADINWIESTRTVEIKIDNKEINLVIGEIGPGLDVPATIIAGRTLVPIRYISESLGASVLWFPSTKTIEIIK